MWHELNDGTLVNLEKVAFIEMDSNGIKFSFSGSSEDFIFDDNFQEFEDIQDVFEKLNNRLAKHKSK